ncbi:MAG: rhomboid family intramembrane serine protease [Acidimicrobiia bacterium]|nr:rhomboid family intramembrane serine protease [Acidimicrobiia bacterium]
MGGRMSAFEPDLPSTCYRHRDRETFLRCSKCDRLICGSCYRDAPVGQLCPECAGTTTRVVNARNLGTGTPSAVLTIIVLTVGSYVLQRMNPQYVAEYAHIGWLVRAGEWWRVITAAFLHTGLLHIVFNMYALYALGPFIERQAGKLRFVGLYLACAVAGGIAFQAMSGGAAVGASGAIFGLFGAVLMETLPHRHTPSGDARFRQLVVLLGINLALPLIAPSIAWQAHIGGLVAGIFITWVWQKTPSGAEKLRVLLPYVLIVAGLSIVSFL